MNRWQFVLHQRALEEIDRLPPAGTRNSRIFVVVDGKSVANAGRADPAAERSDLSSQACRSRGNSLLARCVRP
jgi:hypothetical protein